ncbi:MAG: tetratricopeptide repeat protein [Cyclobacteriaceae bacterium]|nr:tetratricopeptide repeat protein [Cyclobacteriaceae bacterium]
MNRTKWLLFLFGLFFCLAGYGQQSSQRYLDSLYAIAFKSAPDSSSVKAFTLVQRYYFERGQYDSTLKYALLAVPVAERLKNIKALARVYYNLGLIYTNKTDYANARHYLEEAQNLMPQLNDTLLQVNIYNSHALLSNYQSDYSTAVEYLLKAAEIINQSSSTEIKQTLPQVYGNIGHNLIAEKQYEKGIEYEKKALLIKGYPSEARYRVMLHLDIFDAYLKLENHQTAKAYLDSAIQLNAPLENLHLSSMVFSNQAYYFRYVKDYSSALQAYLEAYRLCAETGNEYMKSQMGNNIAEMYFQAGRYDEAMKYALEANDIGKRLKEYNVVTASYTTLKQLAAKKADYKKALEYATLSQQYADSVTNRETQKTVLSLEAKYQHEKREKEITELTIANTQKEMELVKRNRLLLVGGISVFAVLLVLGLLYKNSKQKQELSEREQALQQEKIRELERQQQIVSLQSMINGQEAERTRIARDLHDGLGGLFSTIKMYFSALQHDEPGLAGKELFQKSYTLVDSTAEEVRRIAHNMMPEVLMKLGLVNALKDLCASTSAGKLLTVSLEVHGMDSRLNTSTEVMLFRIVQELLNNIMKHARATEAIIQFIREGNRLSVIVEDNGRGFNTQEADAQKHAGLEAIESRVAYLNGKMSIDSQKDAGTTVMMDFLINN